jgi:lysine 2,3-aminomutase
MQAWQEQLKDAVSTLKGLESYAFFGARGLATGLRFRTLVPRYYLGLIDRADPEDPIAKMAFPAAEEAVQSPGALRDPIGDLARQAAPRLTHRYKDRALLHVTNLCPMYCRFCFRKNLMNEREENLYSGDFAEAFTYLSAHPEIEEVILTGGDPWMLSDEKLSALVDGIVAASPGLRRLRFHTRMPVTLPARVTESLLRAVRREGVRTFVVTHFNHPREVSAEAKAGLALLMSAGFTVLNQAVLLKGVNDDPAVLRQLFLALGNEGVLPYYLHHCDLVAGAEHFRTSIAEGRRIWTELRGTLPGYLIPEYVLDTPGGWGKIPIGGEFIAEAGQGAYSLVRGAVEYRDPV